MAGVELQERECPPSRTGTDLGEAGPRAQDGPDPDAEPLAGVLVT